MVSSNFTLDFILISFDWIECSVGSKLVVHIGAYYMGFPVNENGLCSMEGRSLCMIAVIVFTSFGQLLLKLY